MKKLLSVLLLMIAAVLLVACTKDKKKDEYVYTPSLDKEIEGVVNIAGHYDNFEALEEEFNRFNEYYPNIKLKYTCLDNYKNVIATTLAGDNAPDIYFTYPSMINDSKYSVLFEYAEDLSDKSLNINLDCIRTSLLSKDSLGKVSLVPIYTTTYGMMVNDDIFTREGLKVPTTYSELLDVCDKLKKAGYENPVMGYNNVDKQTSMLYSLFFPHFCGSIAGKTDVIQALNNLEPAAGEYMRDSLNVVADFMSKGYVNLDNCNKLKDDYNAVILRFFEGDIPMMFSSVNTVSGTKKREIQSEAFVANPFKYTFHPVPSTDQGGYFLNNISIGFTVNKNSANLDVTNEFMRFLITTSELNRMADNKRMVTPAKSMALEDIYASFGALSDSRMIYSYDLGLADAPDVQMRKAGAKVTNGEMTVDEAVAAFGTFK